MMVTKKSSAGRVREYELGSPNVEISQLSSFDRTRRYEHAKADGEGFNEVAIDSIIDPDMDTELLAEAEERAAKLDKALAELPPDYAEVLKLFYSEEMSVSEISEHLGITQSLVTTRLDRSRKKLEEFLDAT